MMEVPAMPAVMASPRMNSAPPKFWVALDELVVDKMMSGSRRLRNRRILFLVSTVRSARSKAVRMVRRLGASMVVGAVVLVTDLTPGQADEHVFERYRTACRGPHEGIVPMLVDEIAGSIDSQHPSPVDDGHPVADRLGLLHRVGGEQDAPALG